jgi:hypothetical protein
MQTYTTTEITAHLPDNTACTLWIKGEQKRLYIKKTYNKSYPVDCGYIDMVTGVKHMSSKPANEARYLAEEIEIIKN